MKNEHLSQVESICSLDVKECLGAFIRISHHSVSDSTLEREVKNWLEKHNDLEKIERTMNHLHVRDAIMGLSDDMYDDIAVKIFTEWNLTLKKLDSSFRVLKFEDLGPVVTFFKKR